MDNKKFYSKVLLFGEYGVLSNSNALSIPFEKFYGYLNKSDFLNNEEKISNSNILQLYEFMTDLDIKDKIDFNLFKNDIYRGLHFVSSIPIASGLGSSGALIASVFDSYQKKDNGPINLDDYWKSAYKRQMDLYVWIMKKKGLNVDDIGFFLYCDGDRFTENNFLKKEKALMEFKMTLIEYHTNFDWIEETLMKIYQTLRLEFRPKHSENCEYGNFLKQSFNNTDY